VAATAALTGALVGSLALAVSGPAAAAPAVTTLESKTGAGIDTRVPVGLVPSISGDGRMVAFVSQVGGLRTTAVVAQPAGRLAVLVRDRAAGTLVDASAPPPGAAGANSLHPAVSRNGCHVAFVTLFSFDPVRDPQPNSPDIYRWSRPDCGGGSPVLVSRNSDGFARGDVNPGQRPAISGDGRFVAFIAGGTSTSTNGANRIFRTDLAQANPAGSTQVIPDRPGPAPTGSFQYLGAIQPSISDDGRFVAFASDTVPDGSGQGWASGPCKPPTTPTCPATLQVWRWDGATNTFVQASAAGGQRANGPSAVPSISANGNVVAFTSKARNLVGGVDYGRGFWQVFAVDLAAGSAVMLSRNGGVAANGDTGGPPVVPSASALIDQLGSGVSITGDAAGVAFESLATNLPAGPPPASPAPAPTKADILLALRAGGMERISARPDGSAATMGSGRPSAGATTRFVGFDSVVGSELLGVPDDLSAGQVYLRDHPPDTPPPTNPTRPTTTRPGTVTTPTTAATGDTTTTLAPAPAVALDPPAADFGSAAIGATTGAVVFTVRSTGTAPLVMDPPGIDGFNAADFVLQSTDCVGATLAPGATCSVTVVARPSGDGVRTGRLLAGGMGVAAASGLTTIGVLQPTLLMNPAVAAQGTATVAIGAGFPPATTVRFGWAGGPASIEVTTDAEGRFRQPVLLQRHDRPGERRMVVADEPGRWADVSAPLLVVAPTFQPPKVATAGRQGSLVSR
jgi:hypothetical protein